LVGIDKLLTDGEVGGLQQPDHGLGHQQDDGEEEANGGQQPIEGLAIIPGADTAANGSNQQPQEGLVAVGNVQVIIPQDGGYLTNNVSSGGSGQPIDGATPAAGHQEAGNEIIERAK
jgi:hypothetical protein